jgi:hypothetical protein
MQHVVGRIMIIELSIDTFFSTNRIICFLPLKSFFSTIKRRKESSGKQQERRIKKVVNLPFEIS